jgi:hypothetical protein
MCSRKCFAWERGEFTTTRWENPDEEQALDSVTEGRHAFCCVQREGGSSLTMKLPAEKTGEKKSADEPRDRYNYVYTVIIIIGIGTVLPWNTFINANSVSASDRRDLTFLIILRAHQDQKQRNTTHSTHTHTMTERKVEKKISLFSQFFVVCFGKHTHAQYFVEFKLVNNNETHSDYAPYRNSFISYLGLFSMTPNLILQLWNFLYSSG